MTAPATRPASQPLAWQAPAPLSSMSLEGRWCRLEPLSESSHGADLWASLAGQDHLWTYLFPNPPVDEAQYRSHLQQLETASDHIPLAVIDLDDGKAKGHLSIMRIDPKHGQFEMGAILYAPGLQRSAATTEVVRLVGEHGFSHGYRRFEWKCDSRNMPSRKAALRFGFTFEGIFRQHMWVKGQNRDTAWYAILDHEWPARRARLDRWLDPGNFDADGRQQSRLSDMPIG